MAPLKPRYFASYYILPYGLIIVSLNIPCILIGRRVEPLELVSDNSSLCLYINPENKDQKICSLFSGIRQIEKLKVIDEGRSLLDILGLQEVEFALPSSILASD